ncbi:oligosaccharide flippase family protein [Faecalibacterium duncaniae]|uniref:oligosaccharide flippase family protein n=1 Tax=Faecalibacterium duncaniae (strain DSM 17677 / JCM 31915 / A2-165) TaxID=411483 RepID=UPI0020A1A9BE|nr:oligosaccharide flippase family protein [Faecalibacterium duncaniae]UTB40003.1 oligosaccharide flippase family protein [Faecalibacterium duncaniae]
MMSERKKGAILSYIQVVLSVAVSVIYVPVLLRYLGQSEYGLYQIVGSFFSYISVFESCMSTGVLRNYCNALGSQDKEAADVTLSMAKVIYRVMAALMVVAGVIVLFAFRSFYASSFTASELKESSAILLLLFANMMVTLLGSVYLTILTGHEKFTFLKVLAIIIQVAQPFFVILCVRKIPYAITVSTVIVVFNVLTVLMRYLYVTRKLKIRIVKKKRNRKVIGEIVGLSATILLGCIADQIFWKTDQVILGKLFSTTVVAVYSVGAQIYMMYMQFGTQIASVFYPKVSILYQEENGLQKVSDLFIRVGRATFFVILLVLSGFIIFGREFLLVWVGEGYEAAYWVAIIVMLPFSVDLAQNLGLCILQVKGQYGFRAKIYFLSAVLNIVTTVLFTKLIGIVGAALSTGVSMFLTSGLIMNWYFQRKAGLDIKKFWKETAPVIITAVLLTMSALILKQQLKIEPAGSIWKFGAGVLLYTALYAAVMLGIVANQSEKKQFLQIVTSLNLTLKRK